MKRRAPILVVGAGGIGGTLAGALTAAGERVAIVATNPSVAAALRTEGYRLQGAHGARQVPAGEVLGGLSDAADRYGLVLLATPPTGVDAAAPEIARVLEPDGRVVCFQNGLCEERVARAVGAERVLGAVVAWGASTPAPGIFERTSRGGFTVGRLEGPADAALGELARLLAHVGPVSVTDDLRGARWSKLAINCAVSTLGTLGGDRLGPLLRHALVRRLALELMTEAVLVARAEGVRLGRVAGTLDLDWLALPAALGGEGSVPGLRLRHAVLVLVGLKYRRLRSSMLAAIERGRTPPVDFLNGEVEDRGAARGVVTPLNAAARRLVHRAARREVTPSLALLADLHRETRGAFPAARG